MTGVVTYYPSALDSSLVTYNTPAHDTGVVTYYFPACDSVVVIYNTPAHGSDVVTYARAVVW